MIIRAVVVAAEKSECSLEVSVVFLVRASLALDLRSRFGATRQFTAGIRGTLGVESCRAAGGRLVCRGSRRLATVFRPAVQSTSRITMAVAWGVELAVCLALEGCGRCCFAALGLPHPRGLSGLSGTRFGSVGC